MLHGSVETRGSDGAEVEDKGRDKRRQGETCVLLAFHVTEVSSLPLTAFRDALCRVARPQENERDRDTDSRGSVLVATIVGLIRVAFNVGESCFGPPCLESTEVCIMIQSVGDQDQTGILNFRVTESLRRAKFKGFFVPSSKFLTYRLPLFYALGVVLYYAEKVNIKFMYVLRP